MIFTKGFLMKKFKTKFLLIKLLTILILVSSACALTVEFDPSDKNAIQFGQMSPGDWTELPSGGGYWHALVVKNSVNLPWQVSIKCDGLLTNGAYTIPRDNFKWMATYAGSKNAPYTNYSDGLISIAYRQFYETDQVFFNSASSTALTAASHITTPNGAEIQLKYFIAIPSDQLAGTYTSKITFTVTQ